MSDTLEHKSCADLIAGELADRQAQLEQLYTAIDGNDEMAECDARDEIYSMAYGIEKLQVIRVIWSGGGPADMLEITYCDEQVIRVEYIYQDWFDGARLTVEEGTPAYRYAEEIVEIERCN